MNCYAERLARRLKAMGNKSYGNGFEVTLHERMLSLPATWKKPRKVFVNSMGDLFHESVPLSFIERVFRVMMDVERHVYQVLTKRSNRLKNVAPSLPVARHIWLGVTVEDNAHLYRVANLLASPASLRFVSFEPLLGPLPELNLGGIDWVIVGGESGPGARTMKQEWVLPILEQCFRLNIPFFFKQWGGVNKKKAGRLLDGRLWDQTPQII